VVAAFADCDRDTILFRVRVLGEGKVCHTGTRSCFMQEIPFKNAVTSSLAAQERQER
jgi:phosphoribosyl-ATP pyrophosphohydrolase/phosphoribosyl-AMP cyclohydrolase